MPEVEGNIIRLFDPVSHEPLAMEDKSGSLSLFDRPDARWVRSATAGDGRWRVDAGIAGAAY
jgi:hypothetical protein